LRGTLHAYRSIEEALMQRTERKTAKPATHPPLPTPEALIDATIHPDVVRIPERRVIALDGVGPPESATFVPSIGAIYAIAYGIKFAQKAKGRDFRIGPVESRWWAEPPVAFGDAPRETWRWQLRLAIPAGVTDRDLAAAVEALNEKPRHKPDVAGAAKSVKLITLEAQTLGRVLHIGPYGEEARSLEAARTALIDAGLQPKGPFIEVYLSDPRHTASSRLRTVLLVESAR
jgi:hypothetical protein